MNFNRDSVMAWVVVAHLFNLGLVTSLPRPEPRCPPCPVGGCPTPTACEHGIFTDICGRHSCAKGPGDRCKVRRFRMLAQANCGDGMYCHCGVCMGCSLTTYDCYEDTCVIPMSSK
ncbi:Neuroparsin-A [Folsomia candida]|uniref:Neuroparsin-A n=1 Tax=Folsomia candida TaxID=158441 RepID=A0A226E3W4_FOLCA|nr:Neuroparsin-A [Folsomia candida]